ncbi:TrkH family potassium uptake protein [Jonesia quinghaiensis]|uniref:TrkH family potassium uptake protein n=1 Tax=Jonesia quinghaiensis TaxID=262806 RepID=UPI000401B91E|nr:potassium transporter TrkG [Jonesia quinghaiensis]
MLARFLAAFWAGRESADRIARRYPAALALLAFGLVIFAFAGLLSLPIATTTGVRAPFADALFVATSAVSVTGLTTVDTATHWSFFGQATILSGIQIGGFGVMTLASILGLAVSRKLGLTAKILTARETKTTRLGEVGSLIRVVVITSVTLELCIALLLFPRFFAVYDSAGSALWHSVFFAVSSFNNAGFLPTTEGLMPYYSDWLILGPIMMGVFIGSLGFPVILNLARARRNRTLWTLHTKLTVVTSALLVAVGAVWFLIAEWRNAATLGGMTFDEKILSSLFLAIMPRSGGFNTIDIGAMHESSWLITDALMFVGGGSASTAGGIKVTTLAVLMLAIVAEARGDRDTEVFRRRIPADILRLAVAVTFLGATIILVSCLIMLELTGLALDVILFEVISAFATVGLSTGITPDLPDSAKYMLVMLMYVGRVGTMTFGAALALRSRRRVIRLPEERPIVG